MADQVDVSGEAPGPAGQTAAGEAGSQSGLTAAMALIVGGIIPAGIFHQSFWVYRAPFFLAAAALLLGIPVYLARRRQMSQPAPVPPGR